MSEFRLFIITFPIIENLFLDAGNLEKMNPGKFFLDNLSVVTG